MSNDRRKVKSVSFYVGNPTYIASNKVDITFDEDKLPYQRLLDQDIKGIFSINGNYIVDEETIHYEYLDEEVSLRLIDWIEKFKQEKVLGVQVFKLTNENLSVNHGYIRFNVYQADMEHCLNETNMCLIFFNAIEGNYYSYAEDNYKPSIDELFSTGWYIKND